MSPRPVDSHHSNGKLDQLIINRRHNLARPLLSRISRNLRIGLPTAVTCHVALTTVTYTYVPIRVLGPRGLILWDAKVNGHLATVDGFHGYLPYQVLDDIALYVQLKPSTMRAIGPGKGSINCNYSIHLTTLAKEERTNDE